MTENLYQYITTIAICCFLLRELTHICSGEKNKEEDQ